MLVEVLPTPLRSESAAVPPPALAEGTVTLRASWTRTNLRGRGALDQLEDLEKSDPEVTVPSSFLMRQATIAPPNNG